MTIDSSAATCSNMTETSNMTFEEHRAYVNRSTEEIEAESFAREQANAITYTTNEVDHMAGVASYLETSMLHMVDPLIEAFPAPDEKLGFYNAGWSLDMDGQWDGDSSRVLDAEEKCKQSFPTKMAWAEEYDKTDEHATELQRLYSQMMESLTAVGLSNTLARNIVKYAVKLIEKDPNHTLKHTETISRTPAPEIKEMIRKRWGKTKSCDGLKVPFGFETLIFWAVGLRERDREFIESTIGDGCEPGDSDDRSPFLIHPLHHHDWIERMGGESWDAGISYARQLRIYAEKQSLLAMVEELVGLMSGAVDGDDAITVAREFLDANTGQDDDGNWRCSYISKQQLIGVAIHLAVEQFKAPYNVMNWVSRLFTKDSYPYGWVPCSYKPRDNCKAVWSKNYHNAIVRSEGWQHAERVYEEQYGRHIDRARNHLEMLLNNGRILVDESKEGRILPHNNGKQYADKQGYFLGGRWTEMDGQAKTILKDDRHLSARDILQFINDDLSNVDDLMAFLNTDNSELVYNVMANRPFINVQAIRQHSTEMMTLLNDLS